jgi:hypothetical protein
MTHLHGRRAAVVAFMVMMLTVARDARAEDAMSFRDEFVDICGAAIMQPDALNNILIERGLQSRQASDLEGRRVTQVVFKDPGWRLQIKELKFSDFNFKSCWLSVPTFSRPEELESMKARLEAIAGIGKMEGAFSEPSNSTIIGVFEGVFKRLGNKPGLMLEMYSMKMVDFSRLDAIRNKQNVELSSLQLHRYDFSVEK